MTLIETYPCSDKYELAMRERHYYDSIPNINERRPILTIEEKNEKKIIVKKDREACRKAKEAIKAEFKKDLETRRANHAEKQKQKEKEKGKEKQPPRPYIDRTAYYKDNLEKIKSYYQSRKVKLNEKFTCECGGKTSKNNKLQHEQSGRHKKYETLTEISVTGIA
jgi:predicted phage gp36 major capsid-like protein